MALIAFFVQRHHCGKRKRSALETDDEKQEVTCGNHEIHAEESNQQQLVELAAPHSHGLAVGPFNALDENYNHTNIEYDFDGCHGRTCLIHSCEGACGGGIAAHEFGGETGHGEYCHQYGSESRKGALAFCRHEHIVQEYDQKHDQQADFLLHC